MLKKLLGYIIDLSIWILTFHEFNLTKARRYWLIATCTLTETWLLIVRFDDGIIVSTSLIFLCFCEIDIFIYNWNSQFIFIILYSPRYKFIVMGSKRKFLAFQI